MKNLFTLLFSIIIMTLNAQAPKTIKLPTPSKSRGTDVMTALWNRSSATKFDSSEMKIEDISDLLWAANGINRSETGKKTAPSSYNSQDVDIFLFMTNGVYLYNAQDHILNLKAVGDYRKYIAMSQDFVNDSKQILVFISDISRFENGELQDKLDWANIDTGIVAQNTLLFCSGAGFFARPRVFMDKDKIREILNLTKSQFPILNIPVSYATKR